MRSVAATWEHVTELTEGEPCILHRVRDISNHLLVSITAASCLVGLVKIPLRMHVSDQAHGKVCAQKHGADATVRRGDMKHFRICITNDSLSKKLKKARGTEGDQKRTREKKTHTIATLRNVMMKRCTADP